MKPGIRNDEKHIGGYLLKWLGLNDSAVAEMRGPVKLCRELAPLPGTEHGFTLGLCLLCLQFDEYEDNHAK